MAVAETAELAVKLTLDDSKFARALRGADTRLQGLGRTAKTVGKGVATGLGVVAAGGAVLFVGALKSGMESLRELETVTTQTNAVLASTQGVAGQTADSIRNLAEKYEGLNAIIDDKVIQSGANVLLTFTNIREDAFEPTLAAALDLSTAMGQDLQTSIVQVGKAMNDPVRGLTSLRRVGIQFSETQEKQIKQLVEQNDLYGAQQVILQELGRQFGGSFARQGETAAGAQAKLADAIEDVQKAIASRLLPVVTKVTKRLTDYLGKPSTLRFFEQLSTTLASLFTDENLDAAAAAIETAASAVGTAISAFNQLPPEIKALAIGAFAINKVTGGAVGGVASAFGKILGAGLSRIFAGHVTVIGKSVAGGGIGGATGATSKVGRVATGIMKVALVGIAAAVAVQLGQELAEQSTRIREQGETLVETAKTAPLNGAEIVAAIRQIDEQLEPPLNQLALAITNPLNQGFDNLIATRYELNAKLAELNRTTGAGDERNASRIDSMNRAVTGKIGSLQGDTRAELRATQVANSLQRTANDRLAQIRAKKSIFTAKTFVNVSTRVSVSEFQRQARYSSRVARSTSLAVD